MAQAGHYAEFCMRNSGKMAPTLFLVGADGPLMFVPTSLADENEKDAFATTARLMCIAHAATVCVMAMEAWMKTAKPGEKLDTTEPPSEAFDRQEVVVLMEMCIRDRTTAVAILPGSNPFASDSVHPPPAVHANL